ncbi:hypothetical protein B0T16DRAFT_241588 [Cercophora newfieldiana]|uniref:Survival Motor Neuron Gemin2-binding domain-containing protein n=1 Tax=Cercophora newfieldiana TaxID=92897 RepID=A0AA39XSA2_9PEZI|nr:hypothetical protein B0T16DRAFT_241588 [Cercophora newfieldiana]
MPVSKRQTLACKIQPLGNNNDNVSHRTPSTTCWTNSATDDRMSADKNLTHEEIWDDSALVNSWNQALDEYKKYHSIHAVGGTVEDIVESNKRDAARRDAKPETESRGELIDDEGATPQSRSDQTHPEASQDAAQGREQIINGLAPGTSQGGGIPAMGPQVLLGSVQDEDLKKLLMSWYYAGYYTGLFEGKQQAQAK